MKSIALFLIVSVILLVFSIHRGEHQGPAIIGLLILINIAMIFHMTRK